MKIYVVETQSQHEGGGSEEVFDSLKKARKYIEQQDDFQGWDTKHQNMTFNNEFDFYYCILEYEVK